MGRSLPFLVLMAAIIPFTYWLTGTTIGIPAAVVPMIAAGVPFLAVWWRTRCASCRRRSPRWGVVCGGSRWQIIASAQLSEAMPALVAAVTLNLVSMIEYSAIAGTHQRRRHRLPSRGVRLSALRQPHHDRDDRCLIATIQLIQFWVTVWSTVYATQGTLYDNRAI